MKIHLIFILLFLFSCETKKKTVIPEWRNYDEVEELKSAAGHENRRMQFKLIQSKVLDKNNILKNIENQLFDFDSLSYVKLTPLIYEKDISSIQKSVSEGQLSYKQLTQWYLYRMAHFENNKEKFLNAIISINPKAVELATQKDNQKSEIDHPIYGMPILLKDNINTSEMKTTAGAHALKNNQTNDAFIVNQIKSNGGIILGKVNLSEWAYFFCSGCPLGYSAIGGQSLNPYGRKIFETGGSSAGSGTSMAANFAIAAVGTETSGSILSPSSMNSIVGLKPTIGLLSRTGIVPISSTLDTPGPMTRSVKDNAILLSAMTGEDNNDKTTKNNPKDVPYFDHLDDSFLKGARLGVIKAYLEDSIYSRAIDKIKDLGAVCVPIEMGQMNFEGFVTFLNADMKIDLPKYFQDHASNEMTYKSVKDIVNYNLQDTLVRAPYGQALFEGIVEEDISEEEFAKLKSRFHQDAINFFEKHIKANQLDAILSINNYNAGHAAMAKYPCITVPMGYREDGEPTGLTFIARPFKEHKLIKLAYAFEQNTAFREPPKLYKN